MGSLMIPQPSKMAGKSYSRFCWLEEYGVSTVGIIEPCIIVDCVTLQEGIGVTNTDEKEIALSYQIISMPIIGSTVLALANAGLADSDCRCG